MSWRLHMVSCHVSKVEFRTLLSKVGKGVVIVASSYARLRKENEARYSGQLFNTYSTDVWDLEKKASSSLYLNELPIQNCKFRHRVTVNC